MWKITKLRRVYYQSILSYCSMILAQESMSKSLGESKESRNRLKYLGKDDIC